MDVLYQNKGKLTGLNSFFLVIVFLYIMGSVFYIFRSGLPQPADLILAIGIALGALAVFSKKGKLYLRPHILVLLLFALYTSVLNLLYYAFLSDIKFLLSSVYYIYNSAAFIFFSYIFLKSPANILPAVSNILIASIFVELAAIILMPQLEVGRQLGTFNNPNQLAYWGLLTTCMIIIIRSHYGIRLIDLIAIVTVGFIILLSLSKAGTICYLLLLPCLFVVKSTPLYFKWISAFVFLVLFIFALFQFTALIQRSHEVSFLRASLMDLGSTGSAPSDNFSGRGYTRILENPEYLITGAGEGGYDRFIVPQFSSPVELHSGLGSLLFCYGIFGSLLFFIFLYYVFGKSGWLCIYTLFIIMLYGVVHQNFRFSTFWLYVAVVHGISRSVHEEYYNQAMMLKPQNN